MTEAIYRALPLDSIDAPLHQLRDSIDHEALGTLADSMAAEGLHQPIGVRGPDAGGRYEVVWGHRRFLAARLLAWPTISARVFDPGFDPLLAAVSENLQRTELNPLEEARACLEFVKRGVPVAGIARFFRRSDAWIRGRLALLELPEDLQACIREKALPLAVLQILRDVDHEQYRKDLLREAVRTGASATTAEVWRAHYLSDRDRIIANDLTIDEIASRREHYVISYPCDWCEAMTAYERTANWRLCDGCSDELTAARTKGRQQVVQNVP